MGQGGGEVPAAMQTLTMRAEAAGLRPGTPEYQRFMLAGGGERGPSTVVNVGPDGTPGPQIGTIPQGFSAVPDPNEPSGYRMVRITGGPEDQTAATERRQGRATISGDIITEATDIALAAVDQGVGGVTGWLQSNLPQTQAADLYRQVETLRAQASTTNIQAMREASPTGGALGAVSDRDIALLQNASGAIDPRSPTFERDLLMYTRQLLRTVHGAEAGDAIFSQSYGDRAERIGLRVARPQPMAPAPQAPARPQATIPQPPPGISSDDWSLLWDAFTPEERAQFQ
jgi:hypothetical protein